jgi:alkyl hydroperoxide reductase subunit AhpC
MKIPLIGDISKQISRGYGVLLEEGYTLRGLFIIDGKGIIRHITMNDPPVGRNVDEVLRLVAAYQYSDKKGEVCPCNWQPGSNTIVPTPEGSLEFFAKT